MNKTHNSSRSKTSVTKTPVEEVGQVAVGSELDIKKEKTWLKTKRETSNTIVKVLVLAGAITVILGLIMFMVNMWFSLFLLMLGSAAIIACIFMPIGTSRK